MRFAQEGCNIAFTDIALNDVVIETEKELQALGVKVKAYASNAANFEETHKVVDEIVKDFGRIDILVNNAGITKDTALKRMTEEQWDAVINVNLKSVFNFTKAVQPVMWKQAGGSVINMSSVVGVSGNANQCNYSASKAGIIDHHRHDRCPSRGCPQTMGKPDSAASRWHTRGCGQCGPLPRLRSQRVCYRSSDSLLRRNELLKHIF